MRLRLVASFVLASACASVFTSSSAGAQPSPRSGLSDESARATDPPLIPQNPPLSTSGTDVATPDRQPATPIVVGDANADARREARLRKLEDRVAADERRMRRLDDKLRVWKHITLSAYVQPQLLVQSFNAAASPNAQGGSLPEGIGANDVVARPDGSTTNTTAFRLRRTRLRTSYETDAMRLFIQIDVLPAGGIGSGIGTIVRNAEATGIARWTKDVRTEFTAGMFFTPFRFELNEYSTTRPFIERTWFIQNAFPIERDIGVQARTFAWGDRLVAAFAVVNGQRLGERTFVQTPDLNKSKDLVAFLTYRTGPLMFGVNGYLGRGQVVDPQLLRFKQFTKWGVNYQAQAKARLLPLFGETRVIGELAIAQNLDVGVNYPFAVPVIRPALSDAVTNLDQRALYVRLEQDLARWLMVGYRFDTYTPDTAIKNNARDTHAFLTVVTFSPNLRWMNELDWAVDNVHPSGVEPPSKHIVTFSSVLQAGFY